MDPLSDVLGGNSNVGGGVDHIETTLSATEARLDESAIDGVAEEIRGTVLPVLSDLFDDLLGVKLVRWCELQREGVHDDDDISDALGQLRARVERCTAALLEACRQLEKLHESSASPVLQEATEHAHQLLAAVIRKSTVFTAPPPQVLKTTNKFNVAVCCLAGNALELADMPIVTLSVLSEAQARDLHAAEAEGDDEAIGAIGGGKSTCGQLANNKAELSFDQTTNSIAARFRGMSLKSVKRSATKSDVAVTEEKFCVVAKLEVSVGGGSISVAAMSHPVVVIVHGMQQHNARATILWDSACALPHRIPFEVPDVAPWETVAGLLQNAFRSATGTDLGPEQLDYLGTKLMSRPSDMISWQQFNKASLPGRGFTFWEWFCGITDLTQKCLGEAWAADGIAGFVGKERVQELLTACPPGTFLLRFSDSAVGGITVSWVSQDEYGQPHILHLQPWYAKDFGIRTLSERINDLEQLCTLYPDIPKTAVFPEGAAAHQTSDASYVPCTLSTVIAGGGNGHDAHAARPGHAAPERAHAAPLGHVEVSPQHSLPVLPVFGQHGPSATRENGDSGSFIDLDELLREIPGVADLNSDMGLSRPTPTGLTPTATGLTPTATWGAPGEAQQDGGFVPFFPLRSQRDIF